ncbi:hypothetical protein RJ640_002169 [Escallonia rubra]|uniref:Uncharacterized protein n=1 Tax=Escallonia rubra TaxID=112253 RepID=A0AA88UMM6_9ASTE|nr:hypothetical protein RJ640_002169 [Escallonia rubra]
MAACVQASRTDTCELKRSQLEDQVYGPNRVYGRCDGPCGDDIEEAERELDGIGKVMEYYMDEKWKLSKDDSSSHSYNSSKSSSLMRSISQKSSTTKSKTFSKSSSFKCPLSRNPSQRSSSSKSPLSRSSSQRCADFTRKCSSLAKEQKAKFYIVKRCIAMLISRNKHGDS